MAKAEGRAKPAKNKKEKREVALPPKESDGAQGVLLSVSQAADEFGRDRRTITKQIREFGIKPTGNRGGFPVYRLKDLLNLERKTAEGLHNPDLMKPMERQAHYKAEETRLKVDKERGVLIPAEKFHESLSRCLKAVAQELDVMVDEIERDVGASPAVLEKIESKIDLARRRMYEGITAPPSTELQPEHTADLIDG